jgi:methionyl-tRNA formyltransferase
MRTVFLGTPGWAVASLEALAAGRHRPGLVVTQPPRRRDRGQQPRATPVADCSERLGIECLAVDSIREPSVVERLAAGGADLFVVVAYGEILPRATLELPRLGCVNLHFSLLPRYRGAAPVQWAIAEEATETGVTTMRIVAKLDAGPIYLQEAHPLGPDERAPALGGRLAVAGASLLLRTLDGIERGELTPREQDHERASYARALTSKDGEIDWTLGADATARRVRAFDPWPGQTTRCAAGRMKILEARAQTGAAEDGSRAIPGQVLGAGGGALRIACAAGGVLEARLVRFEGRRTISGEEAFRGRLVHRGEQLGGGQANPPS